MQLNSEIICLYEDLLKAPKNVFGEENMTEEVITQAMSTASYIIWRSIMGGKFEEPPVIPRAVRRI